MTFCVRYRFKLLSPLQIEKGMPVDLTIPGFPIVTIEMCEEAHPVGHWVVAKADGFENEDEARTAGQALGNALLIVGAVTKLGIDVGFSRTTHQFSDAVHAAIRQVSGRELRADTHGLMIYESDTVAIIGLQARLHALVGIQMLSDRLAHWIKPSSNLTERQKDCASLINDSFFVGQAESQFILRISAVEALCDEKIRDRRHMRAIENLEQHLESQQLDVDVRETLQGILASAKRTSLRQSYIAKFKALRSIEEANAFDKLYNLRSRLVHDGIGRGTFNESAQMALDLATGLLEAELRKSQPEG